MKRWRFMTPAWLCAGTAWFAIAGCNGGGGQDVAPPVAPSVTTLTPSSVAAGTGAFTLTVHGSNFLSASAVHWNGAALTTTYVGSSQLTALAPASLVASAGEASITVTNSTTATGTSNAVSFTVSAPPTAPAIASLAPAGVPAGASAFTLVVTGSGFHQASVVAWNNVARVTTYLGPTQLSILVAQSDVAVAAVVSVTVDNPAAEGGASAPVSFTIGPAIASSAYIRSSAAYSSYSGANSSLWRVVLLDVLAGSSIYVVGTWPNFSSNYPSMQVSDGMNAYTLLGRYDDPVRFNLGIQGTQSVGHWYARDVPAGSYTINLAPTPGTFEDFVGLVAFEVAGVTSSPLDGAILRFDAHIAPGTDALDVTLTSSNPRGILIALVVDDVDGTAPTAPLAGSDARDAGALWDFLRNGNSSSRAEFQVFGVPGAHSVHFSPQEAGIELPNYMTVAAFFDASGSAVTSRASGSTIPGPPAN